MIHIQKRRTPNIIKEQVEKIKNTPDSGYRGIVLPEDTKQLRLYFYKRKQEKLKRQKL